MCASSTFTPNVRLTTAIQNSNVMLSTKLFVTAGLREYVYDQSNLYNNQVISCVPTPSRKH
jgi:hypothetical protein